MKRKESPKIQRKLMKKNKKYKVKIKKNKGKLNYTYKCQQITKARRHKHKQTKK